MIWLHTSDKFSQTGLDSLHKCVHETVAWLSMSKLCGSATLTEVFKVSEAQTSIHELVSFELNKTSKQTDKLFHMAAWQVRNRRIASSDVYRRE